MPFDFMTDPAAKPFGACHVTRVEYLANVALGLYRRDDVSTAADRRRVALEAFALAKRHEDDPLIDWREVAEALAAVSPKPRAAPAVDAAGDGEWDAYTRAQRKGRGGLFLGGRFAAFRFADGETIRVSLTHKRGRDLPDWARASEVAVAFYKARRTRNFLRLIGEAPHAERSHAERYAESCAVPEIAEAIDLTRSAAADVSRANAHTADRRDGPRYLSELLPYLVDAEAMLAAGQIPAGNAPYVANAWRSAWHLASHAVFYAAERQRQRRYA